MAMFYGNGLDKSLSKELNKPHIRGVYCLQTSMTTGFLTKVLLYSGQSMGQGGWKETDAGIVMLFLVDLVK